MKNKLTMKNILIAIAFTVLLLLIKDNLAVLLVVLGALVSILTPFFIGFLFAYILNFPYKLLHDKAFRKMGTKHKFLLKVKKPMAITITYLGATAIVTALLVTVIPQLATNLASLVKNAPKYGQTFYGYYQDVVHWANSTFGVDIPISFTQEEMISNVLKFFTGKENVNAADITKTIFDSLPYIFSNFFGFLSSATTGIYNFVMGVVISVYFLAFKEQLCFQMKKLAVAFIPIKFLPKLYEIVDITDTKCGRFLVGDILDSALFGIILFVFLSIFGVPYAPLIAVICGVCNIIPFFGPWIGGIPSGFILALISPQALITFIIIDFVLQQVDANVTRPKIIGNHVGLSSFWVLFSVLVGGALFGIIGFILGTPIYAVIYTLVGKRVRNNLEEKGKLGQEALDFQVLRYSEIAAEQKKIREEKEMEQRNKLKKLIHFNMGDKEDGEDTDDDGDDGNENNAEKPKEKTFAEITEDNKK